MNNISNRPDSNYPPMSDSEWENASFNDKDYPTKEVNVLCSQILSRDTEVEAQYDEYKNELVDVGQDYYNQHETPLSLIDKFYEILKNNEFPKDIEYWKREKNQGRHVLQVSGRGSRRSIEK